MLSLMKNQPMLDLPKTTLEIWLEVASWIFAAFGFALALGSFSDLPEQIPIHFNAAGEADGYSSKSAVFLLPVLSSGLIVLMISLAKSPHQFNYLHKITTENAAFEYRKARMIIRVTNALVSLMFTAITWHIIRVANGSQAKLGLWFGMLIAIIVIAPIVLLVAWRDKKGQ